MTHRTTIVELAIEPADLYGIIQNWALESKFSIYEKNNRRTLYSKNILAVKAWLSIENNEKNAKIEAWLSPRGVGPDFSANFWTGQKIALPKGFAVGPGMVYKKKFYKLIDLLASKSQNITAAEAPQKENNSQAKMKKSTIVSGLAIFGVISFLTGLLGVIYARGFVSSNLPSFAETMFLDSLFDMFFGVLIFMCSRVLAKGKASAIWLYGGAILIDSIFNIVIGQKLNFIFIGFGLLFISQMLKFKKEWELI